MENVQIIDNFKYDRNIKISLTGCLDSCDEKSEDENFKSCSKLRKENKIKTKRERYSLIQDKEINMDDCFSDRQVNSSPTKANRMRSNTSGNKMLEILRNLSLHSFSSANHSDNDSGLSSCDEYEKEKISKKRE
eukprot:Pgem_evm1s8945